MQAHIHSEPGTGDWSRFSTGYGPGATFRGQKLGGGEYVLEHLSGVAFSGTRDELTTLLNDGLHHLEILSGPADHSQTFAPARELPPIAGVDVVKAALAVKPLEPHCNHDPAAVTNGVCECGEIVCRHQFGHRIDDLGVVCGDCGTVLEPAPPAMPESIRSDAARVIADRKLGAVKAKPVDPKDCPHTAASMIYGHYRYCTYCGARTGPAL